MNSEYSANFLNQYVRIPDNVVDKLRSLYPTEYDDIRHCLGLIIVNLLKFGEVAYSRDKNFYSENHTKLYRYKSMLDAIDIAVGDGYAVELSRGRVYHQRGISSVLGAGPRLHEFSLHGDVELDLESLPFLSVEKRPVYDNIDMMFVKERIVKVDTELITLDVYQQLLALKKRLDAIYDEAVRLNRNYWNKMFIDTRNINPKLSCFNRVGLTRIFKDGGVGRWHQKSEMSFQQLPKEERPKLLLNGEKVIELDYSASHPHILYAWAGAQCPDDFYERVMAKCGCSKEIAKDIVLISINIPAETSLIGAVNNTARNKNKATGESTLYDNLKKSGLKAKEVVAAFKEAHPLIAKWVYSASANKLMLVESDILTSVLLKLMKLGIPALPVHDSVVVLSQNEDVARRVMRETFREHTGFDIAIK